jgi:hypothetical protein
VPASAAPALLADDDVDDELLVVDPLLDELDEAPEDELAEDEVLVLEPLDVDVDVDDVVPLLLLLLALLDEDVLAPPVPWGA